VDVYSLSAVANIGFGAFVNVGGSVDVQVLVQNYLYTSEVAPSDTTTIKSFVYGAGFRVALAMYGFTASSDVSFGMIAAKAQVDSKRIAVDIRVIGMPQGPSIPALLTNGQNFDVESYRQLQNFTEAIVKYAKESSNQLSPMPIAATIVALDGQGLLDSNPGVRFAMWRILNGQSLTKALELRSTHLEVDAVLLRGIYATVFRRPEMLRPGSHDNDIPTSEIINLASRWINGYKNG